MPNRDLETEILEFIKEKPNGVTITEISKKKGFSRNTVAKYAAILEVKKKIFSKKIGVYQLFFSTDMNLFARTFTMSYYKAILAGLKKRYPNDKEQFKKIGRESLEYIEALLGPVILEQVKGLNVNRMIRLYYQLFGKVIPSLDMIQPNIEMSMRKNKDNKNKIILKFTDTEFLDNSGDFIYHYYIIAGILEKVWQREVNKNVIVNVETISLSELKDDSYLELSVEFSSNK
ncbi:MAG: hypothetical protein ACFFAH_03375 [Promethearchaeota archaeon]